MITGDIGSRRQVRLKVRLPDSFALALDGTAAGEGKEILIRASVAASIKIGSARRASPRRASGTNSAVAVSMNPETLKLWQRAARTFGPGVPSISSSRQHCAKSYGRSKLSTLGFRS